MLKNSEGKNTKIRDTAKKKGLNTRYDSSEVNSFIEKDVLIQKDLKLA